ncbi:hypothetical protein [Acidipropionibacterium timonense]|uniref:hypothetical protein n=1 Tax=Acidipropionibacterium timonense TaxID=2161818 RepID=UPI00102F3B13|nr:hypothetical protein [Acidipropionibacterium timonense]
MRKPPRQVIHDIAACDAILTTSLYGLIVADALGIPAAWATLEPSVPGGSFKFHDHEALVCASQDLDSRRFDPMDHSIGSRLEKIVRRADPERVEHAKDAVRQSRLQLAHELLDRRGAARRVLTWRP